jgi:coenzyme F420 hydrogenase subunit beta
MYQKREMKSIERLQKIINGGLCNRCGTCVGLSDGKIEFSDKTGKYLPNILDEPDEETSKRMVHACSGNEFNFPKFREFIYKSGTQFTEYTGSYRAIYIGYCTDNLIRTQAASGGVLSSLLIYLLEDNKIDGAVVLGMSDEEPWMNKPFIARTKEEIIDAAQSKYTISSVNEILQEIKSFNGKLAYIGLPGQVQSIRKLQSMNDESVRNIKYIFGPFYGNSLHFSSVKSFLRSYGERDYRKIKKLYFRHGEWPGNMRVEMMSGKLIELPKFHANYLIPFHILKNSLICTDLSNEFTDISVGDAWSPVYEERGKGFSMIISRSDQGEMLLKEMQGRGLIELSPISVDEAISMHSHGYDFKKRGAFIRIRFMKLMGRKVPDYGYTLKGFPASRYIMEVSISILFIVFGTYPARWLVEKFSPMLIGDIFNYTRKIWKMMTKNIKRKYLIDNSKNTYHF